MANKRYIKYKFSIPFSISLGIVLIFISLFYSSCKKFVQIDAPTSSITTSETFSDSADANAAIMGIYANMINTGNPEFSSGAITIYCGLSADELINFNNDNDLNQLYTNAVLAPNGNVYLDLWNKAYPIIYQANACIEGLQASSGIATLTKNQFIGEAKFIRALCYFYLVNLFGDVPYISSIAWEQSSVASRTSKDEIYQNIIADLKDAQMFLRSDYSIAGGERIRANQFAATALLARVYLYTRDYVNAESQSSGVINNTVTYSLDSDLNSVFLKNSSEAILQWGLNPPNASLGNLTPEGYGLVANSATSQPHYYLTQQLLNGFEQGDQRKVAWIDSTTYDLDNIKYYYPYKYKLGNAQFTGADATEYYMVLRLAEQYLIRSEARAEQGNDLSGAISDLNVIRKRAGLPDLPASLTPAQILTAVAQERRIEFFAEWGHRWLDLKRTGQIDAVMSIITPQKNGGGVWNSYQQLYPIPFGELSLDPNLTQNTGY